MEYKDYMNILFGTILGAIISITTYYIDKYKKKQSARGILKMELHHISEVVRLIKKISINNGFYQDEIPSLKYSLDISQLIILDKKYHNYILQLEINLKNTELYRVKRDIDYYRKGIDAVIVKIEELEAM